MIDPQDKPDLAHFGVKGMKWGVRKKRTASEKRARTAKKNQRKAKLDKFYGITRDKKGKTIDVSPKGARRAQATVLLAFYAPKAVKSVYTQASRSKGMRYLAWHAGRIIKNSAIKP